jgi:hypothetical protein
MSAVDGGGSAGGVLAAKAEGWMSRGLSWRKEEDGFSNGVSGSKARLVCVAVLLMDLYQMSSPMALY